MFLVFKKFSKCIFLVFVYYLRFEKSIICFKNPLIIIFVSNLNLRIKIRFYSLKLLLLILINCLRLLLSLINCYLKTKPLKYI